MSDAMRRLAGAEGPRIFRGAFGRIVLPAAIFQIVIVGPGFSTGREVVEFAGRFGALGAWTLLVLLIGFGIGCVLVYELARVLRAYNYREFIRHLIGRAWPLFDVLWITFTIVITGLVTSAVGSVLDSTFGIPELVSIVGVLLIVGVVLFFGRTVIEGFDLVGSIVFSLGITLFGIVVLTSRWDAVTGVFATGDVSAAGDATALDAAWSGILYLAYNIPTLIPVLFCLDRQTRRGDTVSSGLLSGVAVMVPFAITYLALMAFYASGITAEEIPWLVMFEAVGGTGLAIVFALVLTYAVVDTSTSTVHAFLDRVSSGLAEAGRPDLTRAQRVAVIGAVLGLAFVLSRFGVIDLVAQGYTLLAYGFLIVFIVPLVTRGVWLIWQGERLGAAEAAAAPSATS